MLNVDIYTDGACKGNPGYGGWGVYIENIPKNLMLKYYDQWNVKYFVVDKEKFAIKMKGRSRDITTNNQMELQGAIESCKFCVEYNLKNVNIYTDSVYVYKGITEWIKGWSKKGRLRKDSKDPVKNIDLWLSLDGFNRAEFNWFWVKGHSGNYGNDIADHLASCD